MFRIRGLKNFDAIYTVYNVRYENNKTMFLIYSNVFDEWKWVDANEYAPMK